jgi:magnesium chelatase family protein
VKTVKAGERVRSALKNSGFSFPARWITVNLAPADVRKEGPSFRLPVALGLMAATDQVCGERLADRIIESGRSPYGSVRPISGVLPIAIGAQQADKREARCLCP